MPEEIRSFVKIFNTLPDENFLDSLDKGTSKLMILDDFSEGLDNEVVLSLFLRGRHLGLNLIFTMHNLHAKRKFTRDCSLNSNYFIITVNRRDSSYLTYFSRQIDFANPKKVLNIYKKFIVPQKFGHLLIDLGVNTHPLLRFRGKIFSSNPEVYFCGEDIENWKNDRGKTEYNFDIKIVD